MNGSTATPLDRTLRSLPGAHPRQVGCGNVKRSAPVGDRMVKLIQNEINGREIAILDRPIVIAIERLAQDSVDLALHRCQLFGGFRLARLGDHCKQIVSM